MVDVPEDNLSSKELVDVERKRGGYRPRRQPEAVQAEPAKEATPVEEEPRKTRRSRLNGTGTDYDVPPHYRKAGMDYQWWAVKIMGQEIDASEHVAIAEGSWEPVEPSEMPGMVPAMYKGNTIDRRGLRLYKRPMYLTEQARKEDFLIAQQQKQAKLAQAMSTPQDSAPRVGQKLDFSIGPAVES